MLATFRNQQVLFYSTLAIIFTLMAKMLVPLAHASNTSASGEKSFIASLCSGKQVVVISLNLENDKVEPASSVITSKCPLCHIIEQHTASDEAAVLTVHQAINTNVLGKLADARYQSKLINPTSIRAPPLFT